MRFVLAILATIVPDAVAGATPRQTPNDELPRIAAAAYADRARQGLMTDDASHVSTNTVAQSSAPATKATVASPVPSGTPPMPALALAGAGSSGGAADIRAQGRPPAPRGGDAANVLDAPYNADATGAADSTAAFTAALASGRRVVVPSGTYTVCGAIIPGSAELEGAGRDLTVLKAKAGCNADVLLTAGAYSLFGTKSGGGANSWQVSRLSIDGNRAAQTARGAAIDGANCLAVYGAAWRLHEVTLRNCLGHGLRSEWGDGGPAGGLEASLYDVTIDTVGRHGWWFRGPHDIDAVKVIVIDASQEADNTYDGILNQSNGRFFDFHGWHRGVTTNRVAYQFYSAFGSNQIVASHLEGGRRQLYHGGSYDQVIGSFIYAQFGGMGTALVTFAGNNNIHVANQYQGTSGTGAYALRIGTKSNPAAYNQVTSGHFASFDTVGPFNFENDGGVNSISGFGYAKSGGVSVIAGTVAASSRINYVQGGTGMNLSTLTPIAQIADGSVAHGNARGAGAVDLQTSRTRNVAVAAGASSGILSGTNNLVGSGTASVVAGGSGNGVGNSNYATVAGGENNYATGNWSATLGGQNQNAAGMWSGIIYGSNNTADGTASSANGLWATARGGHGANALASGRFSAAGDAQRRETVLRGSGSGATVIRLTADGAAAGAANCINIADATAYNLEIRLIVRSMKTPKSSYSWVMPVATLLRGAGVGSTSLTLGTPATTATNSFTPTVSATADTINGCINLSVKPPADNTDTLRAVARIESVEVQ